MSTTNITLNDGLWKEIYVGPTSTPLTIGSRSRSIQIAVASSTPTIEGFKVLPNTPYNVTLQPGENLYAKSIDKNVIIILNS